MTDPCRRFHNGKDGVCSCGGLAQDHEPPPFSYLVRLGAKELSRASERGRLLRLADWLDEETEADITLSRGEYIAWTFEVQDNR